VDRELILSLAHQAGWNLKFTRQTSELDFSLGSEPFEIEALEMFVSLIIERVRPLSGGEKILNGDVEGV